MKKILLIAFKFPPMGGVGTRRWAKFSKFLAKGYTVHVVSVRYPFKDAFTWSDDVRSPNIVRHECPSHVPSFMLRSGQRRFLWKLVAAFINRVFRHDKIDIADGWQREFMPQAIRLIRDEQIKTVVVTGPPSSMHYQASELREVFPDLNLILDYRDPWNSDRDYQVGQGLKCLAQKERSLTMEKQAVTRADRIVVVTRDMQEQIAQQFPEARNKIAVVHNGFDPDEFAPDPSVKPTFSLIYAGLIGSEVDFRFKAIELLAAAISELRDPFVDSNLSVSLFSDLTAACVARHSLRATFAKHFHFNSFVPNTELPRLIAHHGYGLAINAKVDAHAFGSKVFDYMAQRKRILVISEAGELSDVLRKRGSFTATYSIAAVRQALLAIKDDFLGPSKTEPDYAGFDLPTLTKTYASFFV